MPIVDDPMISTTNSSDKVLGDNNPSKKMNENVSITTTAGICDLAKLSKSPPLVDMPKSSQQHQLQSVAQVHEDLERSIGLPLRSVKTNFENAGNVATTNDSQQPSFSKQKYNQKSVVRNMSEWVFPGESAGNKFEFVSASLRQGKDAHSEVSSRPPRTQIPPRPSRRRRGRRKRYDEQALEENIIGAEGRTERPWFGSPKSRRRVNDEVPTFEKRIISKATDIEYDSRFLGFDVAPDGSIKEEKLVWRYKDMHRGDSYDVTGICRRALRNLPKRMTQTRSRIGPLYQARIPKKRDKGDYNNDPNEVPGYDKIWDPDKADEAEKNGADITGYLFGKRNDLCKTEFLMSILHENNYDIERSKADHKRVELFQVTDMLNSKQRELEDDWCAVKDGKCAYADDEHTLIVCDGCGRGYHLECLGLVGVPVGDWYCPVCHDHYAGVPSSRVGVVTRKAVMSLCAASSSASR